MNIAFILSYWQDRFGGPVRIVKEQGRVLADMGHNVSYWAPDEGDAPDDAVAVDNLHRCRCDRPRSWRRSRDLVRRLSRSAHRFDVIDISELWTHPPYAAGRIAAARGVPYVIRPAGGLERWSLQRGYLRSLKKRAYLKCILKPVIDRAACLQAASTKEVDSLRRSGYQGPVAVIPGAVDTEALCPVDSSESHEYWPELKDRAVVLFMSRLSPEKGLNILIPLWADLVRSPSYRDALLILAGPDYRGYGKKVEALIDKHALQPHVRVVGMVQGPRKRALLSRADVFVLPSHSENFGIVVAEALACQTPVIATTSTPWQQLHTADAGRWVAPSEAGLIEALRDMLSISPSQRAAMGNRGRKLVQQHYTWQTVAGQYLTMCDCILQGRAIPLHPKPARSPILSDA